MSLLSKCMAQFILFFLQRDREDEIDPTYDLCNIIVCVWLHECLREKASDERERERERRRSWVSVCVCVNTKRESVCVCVCV